MRLRVQYTAQLRTVVGRAEEEIELAEGSSLAELLVHIASELRREAVRRGVPPVDCAVCGSLTHSSLCERNVGRT